jgi:hypothetical protein
MKPKLSLIRKFIAPTPAKAFRYSMCYGVAGVGFLFVAWFFLSWEMLVPAGVCVLYAFVLQFRVDYVALALDDFSPTPALPRGGGSFSSLGDGVTMVQHSFASAIAERDYLKKLIADEIPGTVQYAELLKALKAANKRVLGFSVKMRAKK